jgi:hypothetical protein
VEVICAAAVALAIAGIPAPASNISINDDRGLPRALKITRHAITNKPRSEPRGVKVEPRARTALSHWWRPAPARGPAVLAV